jgi:hypothetical protein
MKMEYRGKDFLTNKTTIILTSFLGGDHGAYQFQASVKLIN